MKRILKYFGLIIICQLIWGIFIFSATANGWYHRSITNQNTNQAFLEATKKEINKQFVGNFALGLFENGKVTDQLFYSQGAPVHRNTIFQVASLSKLVSAIGVMKLVEDGKLDLDTPVNKYLNRWQLPPSEFDNNKVTIRRLLSHTAGLTDELGYSGVEFGKETQPIEESLTKALDADEGSNGEVKVGIAPGSEFKYSGGGYTLLQLIIEENSGQSFNDFMKETIFKPLKMIHSSYEWNDSSNNHLSEFYHKDGTLAKHYVYTSQAATSLYTSLSDLELFFQFYLKGENNEPIGRNVLKPEILQMMREPHASVMGEDIWGLGTMLYAHTETNDFIIGHDGKSTPPINTAFRLDPSNGNGIVILETGHPILATKLSSEWVFWKTGKIDTLLFTLLQEKMMLVISVGSIIILIALVAIAILRRKKQFYHNS